MASLEKTNVKDVCWRPQHSASGTSLIKDSRMKKVRGWGYVCIQFLIPDNDVDRLLY